MKKILLTFLLCAQVGLVLSSEKQNLSLAPYNCCSCLSNSIRWIAGCLLFEKKKETPLTLKQLIESVANNYSHAKVLELERSEGREIRVFLDGITIKNHVTGLRSRSPFEKTTFWVRLNDNGSFNVKVGNRDIWFARSKELLQEVGSFCRSDQKKLAW